VGETLAQASLDFNHTIRVENRSSRLTADPGSLLLREVVEKLGIVPWLTRQIDDPRREDLITHPLSELLRTLLLLFAQGWRDQDDADELRDDPAMRLAVSDRRGVTPLFSADSGSSKRRQRSVPAGLASQPTLSRLISILGTAENMPRLRRSLVEVTRRRLLAASGGRRRRHLTVDIDSLPVEVHGHQPGSQYNGHYHARIYHPLIASIAETGDLVDGMLRPGRVHTGDIHLEDCVIRENTGGSWYPAYPGISMHSDTPCVVIDSVIESQTSDRQARVRLPRPGFELY